MDGVCVRMCASVCVCVHILQSRYANMCCVHAITIETLTSMAGHSNNAFHCHEE